MLSPITDWNKKFIELSKKEDTQEVIIVYDKGKNYIPKIFRLALPTDENLICESELEEYITTFIYNRAYAIGAKKINIHSSRKVYEMSRAAFMDKYAKFHHVAPFLSQIYEHDFQICHASSEEIQQIISKRNDFIKKNEKSDTIQLAEPRKGKRIGVDMGGSDIKVIALENGKLKYYKKMNWNPRAFTESSQHYQMIQKMIDSAIRGANFGELDGIGISTAGIVVDSRIMISGLFRSLVPSEFEQKIKPMNRIISEQFDNVPVHVLHDGDAAAIWAYFEMGLNNVLGLAFGTGLGAGYADENGKLVGYLCEIGKSILDMSPDAPEHIYNHTRGPALHYLSQNAVFRLANKARINIDQFDELAEELRYVQKLATEGKEEALEIFEKIGEYLAVGVSEFYNYFQMQNVVIFGRVTSGLAGEIILKNANQDLMQKFPEIASKVKIHLPSTLSEEDADVNREFGQAIAAAYFSRFRRLG